MCAPYSRGATTQGGGGFVQVTTCTVNVPPSPWGSTLYLGTNSFSGGSCTGEPQLQLALPNGQVVKSVYGTSYVGFNTNACNLPSVGIELPPAPVPGGSTYGMSNTYVIQEGCQSKSYPCSAKVAWSILVNPPPPPPPGPPPPTPPPSPPPPPQIFRTVTCASYGSGVGGLGVFSTLSGYRNIATCTVNVPPSPQGSVLTFGTQNVPGSQCKGNTYLALNAPGGSTIATSDDFGGNQCSYATKTLPPAPNGAQYTIVHGCNSAWTACGGVTAWSLTLTLPPPSPPPSPSPPPPTVYSSQHLLFKTQPFQQRVIGAGQNNPHAHNSGATSTSTETTASGNVNFWEDTTTTMPTQKGLGNGHTTHQSTTSDTTATGHPLTKTVFRKPGECLKSQALVRAALPEFSSHKRVRALLVDPADSL